MADVYTRDGRSPYWYYTYYRDGKRYRRSTGVVDNGTQENKQAARDVMTTAMAEHAKEGPPAPGHLTLADLRDLVVTDYELNGRKSLPRLKQSFRNLEAHFGARRRVSRIDTRAVREYARKRRKAGRAPATINRELAALRRAFNLAKEQSLFGGVPVIRALKERNTRTGFLSRDELERLCTELPSDVATLARVGYETGWRRGELLSRRWKHCDLRSWLRLEPGETKNEQGRQFPMTDELYEILSVQHNRATDTWGDVPPEAPIFFYYRGRNKGKPIKNHYKAWRKATKAAGLEEIIFHDLRRSAVRNLVRAGVKETVAMRLTGHKTRSVFERYNIVDERDLLDAMERLNRLR